MFTLKILRQNLRISQAKLAALIGVHPLSVSKWERGLLKPNRYKSELLHAFYKASKRNPELKNTFSHYMKTNGAIPALSKLLEIAFKNEQEKENV